MIEQRTLLTPGKGIVRADGPTTEHEEYPKHMVHRGYQPGFVGTKIESPHGFSYYQGGTPIRFPPVLVMTKDQEEYHASQGYESIGKSDPAAFAKAVAEAAPLVGEYKPEEYPKWVNGKTVNSAEEEAKLRGPTLTDTGVSYQEAVAWLANQGAPPPVAELEAKSDQLRIAELEAELAALKAGKSEDAIVSLVRAPEPLVMKLPTLDTYDTDSVLADDIAKQVAEELSQPTDDMTAAERARKAKSDKMKAWHADRKAKKAAEQTD